MYPTNTDTSVLNVETADSITRYQGGGNALPDDYFSGTMYPHLLKESYSVITYIWDYNNLTNTEIQQYADLSDKVIDVSYSCDSSNNIKQSVNLTLNVPPNDAFWYSNQIYNIGSGNISGEGHYNGLIMWTPQIYQVSQIFENEDETIDIGTYRREFGFFIPDNTSYTYDNETSKLSLTLVGLSYLMTAEGGGVLATALRTYDYYFYDDYNNNPRTIRSYYNQTIEEEQGQQNFTNKVSLVQVAKTSAQSTYEKDWLMKQEEDVYNSIPVNASKYGTAAVLYGSGENKNKRAVNVPLPLSISGEDGFGAYTFFSGGTLLRIIYKIVRCGYDVIMNNFNIPLTGFVTPHGDAENVSKSYIFPNGWDFENGANMMDIAQTILKDKYYDPMIWVDENRRLCVDTVPPYRNKSRSCIYYSYYGELVISEDISFNEDEFFDAVEVYGKNGEYYGIADATFNGFKAGMGIDTASSFASAVSLIPKIKTISDDSLESDEDCYKLAHYEAWKVIRGNTTINVKLRDNCMNFFTKVSHIVGLAFVEYKMMQGDGKPILCILKKASLSGGIWTWELTPYYTFAPSYSWYANNFYWRWKTPMYDQFLAARWDKVPIVEGINEEEVSQQTRNTLSQPAITNWDIENDNIILYVQAIDLYFSVVNVYKTDESGNEDEEEYIGVEAETKIETKIEEETEIEEEVEYKVVKIPLLQNGIFTFRVELYNPLYETSKKSDSVTIYVGRYTDPETGETVQTKSIKVTEKMLPKALIKKYPDDIIYNEDTGVYYYVDPETGDAIPINPKSKKKIIIHHRPYLMNEKSRVLATENNNKLTL